LYRVVGKVSSVQVVLASGKKLRVSFDREAFEQVLARAAPELFREAKIRVTSRLGFPGLGQAESLLEGWIRTFHPNVSKEGRLRLRGLTIPWFVGGPQHYWIFLFLDRLALSARSEKEFRALCGHALAHEIGHLVYYCMAPSFVRTMMALQIPGLFMAQASDVLAKMTSGSLQKLFSTIPRVYVLSSVISTGLTFLRARHAEAFSKLATNREAILKTIKNALAG